MVADPKVSLPLLVSTKFKIDVKDFVIIVEWCLSIPNTRQDCISIRVDQGIVYPGVSRMIVLFPGV